MTSNDVVDTAQALQIRDAAQIIERDLVIFGEVLDLRAHEFRQTPQIGRTHGIHAEPITFGLKIANWFAENQRNIGPPARCRGANEQSAKFRARSAMLRHLEPPTSKRASASELGLQRRAGCVTGDSARSARAVRQHAGADRATLEKIATRDSPFAAHGSARIEEPFER